MALFRVVPLVALLPPPPLLLVVSGCTRRNVERKRRMARKREGTNRNSQHGFFRSFFCSFGPHPFDSLPFVRFYMSVPRFLSLFTGGVCRGGHKIKLRHRQALSVIFFIFERKHKISKMGFSLLVGGAFVCVLSAWYRPFFLLSPVSFCCFLFWQ